MSVQKRRRVGCRDQHAHILAEKIHFVPSETDEVRTQAMQLARFPWTNVVICRFSRLDKEKGTLKVSGYVRGRALTVNGLVHIPGLGDFQLSQVRTQHLVCEAVVPSLLFTLVTD